MTIVCPKCQETLGTVNACARLLVTVHCPFDGHDFGVAVDPPQQTEMPGDDGKGETVGNA